MFSEWRVSRSLELFACRFSYFSEHDTSNFDYRFSPSFNDSDDYGDTCIEMINYIRSRCLRILIIDDEDAFREAMTYNLTGKYAAQVTAVNSGEKAIEKLRAGDTYNLIFLDLMMRPMDGITTFKELKAINEESRIVIMSAYSESQEWNTAKEMGIELLAKPPSEKRLMQILQDSN